MKAVLLVLLVGVPALLAQKDPHFAPGRHTIVHLFEWTWDAIAQECESFLGPKGFGGVQISPPNENVIIPNRPWYERYQPVSYILSTRSGDRSALASMIQRCNNAGVRIYVDAVINHMAAQNGVGTGGSQSDAGNKQFPAVPYGPNDFHPTCSINNYQDPDNVRNCELEGLKDLDQSHDYVRSKLAEYMNTLIDMGVAGFRIDAAKHISPNDLGPLYAQLKDTIFGGRPFIYQEVIDLGGEPISKHDYTGLGTVLEFLYGTALGDCFQGRNPLKNLYNWGPEWGLLDGLDAVPFIDNHDNQRHGSSSILTYKNPKPYKMAIAFMLAHPYGTPRIMSSFAFDNSDLGPPQDQNGNIIPPGFNPDGTCSNGWVCEHRWRQIYNMVGFRNTVGVSEIANLWVGGDNKIGFSRGNSGFVIFTLFEDIDQDIQTGLPAGRYCDVISGEAQSGSCTGKTVEVRDDGIAHITLLQNDFDGVLAIHINARI